MMNRIRECRKKAGLTQAQLAKKAMVSVQAVQKWEVGKRNISVTSVEKMAIALNVNPGYLINWSDKATPLDERQPQKKYTVRVFPGSEGYLNLACDGDLIFTNDNLDSELFRAHFTQAELEALRKRDDVAIDWDKAKIEEVEDDEC